MTHAALAYEWSPITLAAKRKRIYSTVITTHPVAHAQISVSDLPDRRQKPHRPPVFSFRGPVWERTDVAV